MDLPMKRICSILLAASLAVMLAACGTTQEPSGSEPSPDISSAQTQEPGSETTAEGNGNVLVAYFTHEGNNVFDGDLTDVDAITSATVQRDGDEFPPQVIDGEHKYYLIKVLLIRTLLLLRIENLRVLHLQQL